MTEKKDIKLIVVDVDATLLNDEHQLSDKNKAALKQAMEQGVPVTLATGKTYQSTSKIIEALGLKTPGIFVQGLMICEPDGKIKHQQTLSPEIARQVITFAEDRGFNLVAYCGDRLLAKRVTPGIEQLGTRYNEPMPEGIGPLQNILGEIPVNKLIAVKEGNERAAVALRWQLSRQLDGSATLVQTMLKDMIEILPYGASKGASLRVLIKELGIDPAQVLAIGDAENDTEMLELAGVSVAVGNANQQLKDAVDYVVASNNDDGVAEAVTRFVIGQPEPAPADGETKDGEETASGETAS
jgi:Cof subfamily protein (haloacid dehalogenase superfamily)